MLEVVLAGYETSDPPNTHQAANPASGFGIVCVVWILSVIVLAFATLGVLIPLYYSNTARTSAQVFRFISYLIVHSSGSDLRSVDHPNGLDAPLDRPHPHDEPAVFSAEDEATHVLGHRHSEH